MSDELQLSKNLIDDVMNVVINVDSRAKDPFVGSQYLSAIIGYIVGSSQLAEQEKQEIAEELSSFMMHVMKDVAQPAQQAAQPMQQAPVAPPGQAFGIWKPN